jgi:hypothetical protein
MTERVDAFAHPFWDRDAVSNKAIGMRRQGFSGQPCSLMSDLEYTKIMEKLCQRILLFMRNQQTLFQKMRK